MNSELDIEVQKCIWKVARLNKISRMLSRVNPRRIGAISISPLKPMSRAITMYLPCFDQPRKVETCHAHGHLEYLEATGDPATGLPIGPTSDNLKAAIAGETHEYTDMYPGMAKAARDEGFGEIADWMETLAKAERSHANRFQKALDGLDD